jgi:hypothetical protein
MAVWIVIGVLVALLVFFCLAILGTMQEVVALRSEVKLFRDIVQHPPPPAFVGGPAPSEMVELMRSGVASDSDKHVVAFIAPGCGPCEDLASGLTTAVSEAAFSARDVSVVIWAATADGAHEFADRIPLATVLDVGGKISRRCEVRSTPTLFLVSQSDLTVADYSPEGSLEWIKTRLAETQKMQVA